MADFAQKSDPGENYMFCRDWCGAGYFHLRLAQEAELWLADRRKKRARAGTALSRHARMRSWRAST